MLYSYKYWWIAILVFATILRLYGLGANPVGLSHDDEVQNLLNAKSLAVTGQPSGGTVTGVLSSVTECPGNCVYGELTSYILIPWMRLFPLDLFWSKIPFALASILIVYFTGKLFENLSKNKLLGIFVGFLVAINPWAIHLGRMAYENNFSYLFYILGAYFFTRPKFQKSNLTYGTLFSIFGFLFYFGTKPILPFIVLWGFLYNIVVYKKFVWKTYFSIGFIFILFLGVYFFALTHSFAGRRLNEISIDKAYNIESIVNDQRRISLNAPVISSLFINKYTVKGQIYLEKLLEFFSPVYLYLKSTGGTDAYYISNHAYNYLIDLPLLVFGLLGLAANFAVAIFTLSLLVLSVGPAILRTDTIFTFRSGLAYPILAGLSGWGVYYLYSKMEYFQKTSKHFKKFPLGKIFLAGTFALYGISLAYFLTMYWVRMPIEKSEGWYFHKRVITSYITQTRKDSSRRIIVITAQPPETINTYAFYSGEYENAENIIEINEAIRSRNYSYQNTYFTDSCNINLVKELSEGTTVFVESDANCNFQTPTSIKIANPRDAGGQYDIYGDTLCTDIPKNKYPYPRSLKDFQVEKMDKEQFCKTWITNPDI